MPVTGNPIIDWILTVITAIGVVMGALVLIKGQARKLATPEGSPPFGNRSDDLRMLNLKHENLSDQVDEHETKIIVLQTKEKSADDSVREIKAKIETNRVEQRETNKQLFATLKEHQHQMTGMERENATRHIEIKDLLVQIQRNNGNQAG